MPSESAACHNVRQKVPGVSSSAEESSPQESSLVLQYHTENNNIHQPPIFIQLIIFQVLAGFFCTFHGPNVLPVAQQTASEQ